ncbi:MAG: alpha/beta hydrolase [Candidatus Thalassarchaeum betae]|uniref:Alpha/beta hydrolase n=1 Tax=Candidatus Thalassarchaeum betae TaxID=2599289 RepID=A0A2V3HTD3_9ARCH|nr:MAG: alpha/beta hydrolase [Candidatus Thalassoarchaea betae]PXF27158.1 MAG: alpha/beta hydrolase [Euryarchaeota archaeon]HIM13029.1 alpha/beta hydrolase [Candidatus Poseidoniales archaeon]HIM92723.1 alpha/beta hydrolase [Candidatus Poseidoniales archaeon]
MLRLLKARDGRTLDVLLAGDDDSSFGLVCHHGTPSDATIWSDWHEDALSNNLRLVAISRPGYGLSDRLEGRRVASVAEDVEDVLDALGIPEFVSLGWSGGGPHALACGALLPERCKAVSSLAGVGPYGEPDLDFLDGMGPENVEEFGIALEGEEALRRWMDEHAEPYRTIADEELAEALGGLVPEIDVLALNEQGLAAMWAGSMRRCFTNGWDGWIDDDMVFCNHWGFEPSEITVPVAVWQGDLDLMVPFAHGEWLLKHIPTATARLEPGHGHLSLIADRRQAIIDDLTSHR